VAGRSEIITMGSLKRWRAIRWLRGFFHSTALAQTCGDFFLQLACSLEEQRHIDSFRTHPHSVIVREV
uniref:hypothetical protein n=1 Tax=Corynebacterium belfantii TaxID=2014537 RepID=UPI00248C98EB